MAWCHWRFVPPSFRGLRPWSPAVCRIFVALPPVQVVWQSLEKNRTNPGDIIGLMVKYVKSMVPIHHSFFFRSLMVSSLFNSSDLFKRFWCFFGPIWESQRQKRTPLGPISTHLLKHRSTDARCLVFLKSLEGLFHGKATEKPWMIWG